MIPTLTDIDEYVMENSAVAALKEMIEDGFDVSYQTLRARIQTLNASGKRQAPPHDMRRNNGFIADAVFEAEAVRACELLLRAQMASGQVMPIPMRAWHLKHASC